MYTINFIHEDKMYPIRRIQCIDGIVRALGPDVFRAVNSSNITIHLRQFKDILKVHQCVDRNVITLHKKQFNSNVCESRTMTQAQIWYC